MSEKNCKKPEERHISVLLEELVESIDIFSDRQNIIVDATLGMGGHASQILKKLHKGDIFIGFDADVRNLEIASKKLSDEVQGKEIELFFVNANFSTFRESLKDLGIQKITGVYYDLGISSLHVDEAQRGFSFKNDGPLDMRFDTQSGSPASHIVNSYSKDDLYHIFKEYGEEPMSKKIAEAIFAKRKTGFRFQTTKELADIIDENSKIPKSKTRVFQALRIETNKELDAIETSLKDAIDMLDVGGKIFVISFHSLEDRIVKNIFRDESKDCLCNEIICMCHHKKQLKVLTKKPILPQDEEIKANPRSRSAKARLGVKIA